MFRDSFFIRSISIHETSSFSEPHTRETLSSGNPDANLKPIITDRKWQCRDAHNCDVELRFFIISAPDTSS